MSLAYAITSGTTTIDGGGTVPPPPAVTGAWLSGLGYWTLKYGNLWKAGYQGTLTPPAGTDTDHITAIHISRIVSGQRSALLSLAGPFPVGDARGFKSDAVDVLFSGPVTLEFVTENEDGSKATYTTTVTLTAPSEASVTAAEATPISTTRHQTWNRGVCSTLTFTPVINNPLWPLPITVWTNHPGGVRKWRGWPEMQGPGALQLGAVGTASEFDIIPPTAADETWTLTYAIGTFDEQTAPPASAKTSAGFTVVRPPAPGTTDATGAYVDAITYAQGLGGASMFGLPHIYVTLPLGSNNFMFARLMLQTGTGTGGSFVPGGKHPLPWNVGDWVNDDSHAEGFYRVAGSNQIYCNVPNVWDVPSDSNITHRLWWIVASRRDDGTGATKIQQNCWSSAVGVSTPGTAAYQDVVVDKTKSQISTGTGTIPDGNGGVRLNTTNLSNLLFNAGFEESSLAGWKKVHGTEIGYQASAGFAYSGISYFMDAIVVGGGVYQDGISCRPGDLFNAECWLAAGFGTTTGTIYLSINYYNNAGALISSDYNALTLTGNIAWTRLAVECTAPATASTLSVKVQMNGPASGTGYWYVDNVALVKQISPGPGTTRDGKGGVRLNTSDLSNMVMNGSFENGMVGWEKYQPADGIAVVQSGMGPGAGTMAGGSRLAMWPGTGGLITVRESSGHAVQPGEQYYMEIWIAAGGNLAGTFYLYGEFLDAADNVRISAPMVASLARSAATNYTLMSGMVTVPAGASYLRVYFESTGMVGDGNAVVDSVLMRRQVSTGPGTTRDGKGGVKLQIDAAAPVTVDGSGNVTLKLASSAGIGKDSSGNLVVKNGDTITFDGSGNVKVNAGPGLTVNGGGALVPNQGATVGVNASGQLIVPSGSLGKAEFGSGLEPYAIYYGLPGGGAYTAAPTMIINSGTVPWSVWRKDAGGWRAVLDTRDVVAGNVVATVSLTSPSISGGTVIGATFKSDLNNVTCEMNGSYDAAVGSNTGLKVWQSNASNLRTVVTPNVTYWIDSSNVVRARLDSNGSMFLYDSVSRLIMSLSSSSGSIALYGTDGATKAELNNAGNNGHLYLYGSGASVVVNGRTL